MIQRFGLALLLSIGLIPSASAQAAPAVPTAQSSHPKPKLSPVFVDVNLVDFSLFLPAAPTQSSVISSSELEQLHELERTRTPAQIALAQFDDVHEDMTIYSSILGPDFNPGALPSIVLLGSHVRNDASNIVPPLKALFSRPRPFDADPTLHPVCAINHDGSYPSGHTFAGYISAYMLIQMVPERKTEILARADDYAHNRLVCGVHYPSDLEVSRRVAILYAGYLLDNPRFERELAAATTEVRAQLHLVVLPTK